MIEAFVIDINGVLRGKWLPETALKKVQSAGLRLPHSAFAPDIWGNDVPATGLIRETGDNDGVCRIVKDSVKPAPWLKDTGQALLTLPGFAGDPRQVLAQVLALYKKAGLTPVVAAELEFYLIDAQPDERGRPQPPLLPNKKRAGHAQTYSLGETDAFRKVLGAITRACKAQGLPADAVISENGPGQMEINLHHEADALAAADHAVLLKRAIKGCAQQHGMNATFMAKPYAESSGSGMHVHMSILDKQGRNIFATQPQKLKHAIGGLLATMAEHMLIFAPGANSYRRFRAGTAAPTKLAWGYDNRSTALRVPQSEKDATRIEHRVSGADANPHLVFAAILAGALHGLQKKINPPAPVTGDAYKSKAKTLPTTWEGALAAFGNSTLLDRRFKKIYSAVKRQEIELMAQQITSAEIDAYLRDV